MIGILSLGGNHRGQPTIMWSIAFMHETSTRPSLFGPLRAQHEPLSPEHEIVRGYAYETLAAKFA